MDKLNILEPKRLGIFVFYNKEGQVNDAIIFLLNHMTVLFDRFIVTVNGHITSQSKHIFESYTPEIYIRDNIGYDGGAYKDIFLDYLNENELNQFDEVVLFNDTFYGPFSSLEAIFEVMEKEDIDFWGLTKWPEKKMAFMLEPKKCISHIQSYFIVVKKQMMISKCFIEFWENLSYPETYYEAIEKFEIYFTSYFTDHGFKSKSWVDYWNENNSYSDKLDTDISIQLFYKIKFPIIKKRKICFLDSNEFNNLCKKIESISDFPIHFLEQDRKEMLRAGKCLLFSLDEINDFIKNKDKLYLYGNGTYKNIVLGFLEENGYHVAGIVVSKKTEDGVIEFSKLSLDENDGIIIALGYPNFCQVKKLLMGRVKDSQLLFPDCVGDI